MTGDHVEPPIADTELLPQIAAKSFTPYVHAHRGSTEGEAVACLLQAVAQVVVVAVSETLVEQSDVMPMRARGRPCSRYKRDRRSVP